MVKKIGIDFICNDKRFDKILSNGPVPRINDVMMFPEKNRELYVVEFVKWYVYRNADLSNVQVGLKKTDEKDYQEVIKSLEVEIEKYIDQIDKMKIERDQLKNRINKLEDGISS